MVTDTRLLFVKKKKERNPIGIHHTSHALAEAKPLMLHYKMFSVTLEGFQMDTILEKDL